MPPAVSLQKRNLYELTLPDGTRIDVPCFTCVHCQRAITMDPGLTPETRAKLVDAARARGFQGEQEVAFFEAQFEKSATCSKCHALICTMPGCLSECRNAYQVDGPLATNNVLWQPWLVRDAENFPVDRLYLANGEMKLIRRRDNGMTTRELERQAIPNHEHPTLAGRAAALVRARELDDERTKAERDARMQRGL